MTFRPPGLPTPEVNAEPATAPGPRGPSLFLLGPTAVGKSAVAVALAEQLGGEIISVDSMQVYRGLDLGTDKPAVETRRRVRHHLVDVVGLDESFDAAQFVALATRAEADIQARGRVPVFCGGTGLYAKAFLEGLDEVPSAPPALRAELEATPLPQLLAELERLDPAAGATLDRRNARRVIRAVEILRLTGRPRARARLGEAGAVAVRPADPGRLLFALTRASADLRARIEARVDAMFAAGLVAETRALLEQGLERNRTARQAIGYRQVVEHLRGERTLAETMALVRQKSRQFARRQMTWFRHQLPVEWVLLSPQAVPSEVAGQLADRWREAAGFPSGAGVLASRE